MVTAIFHRPPPPPPPPAVVSALKALDVCLASVFQMIKYYYDACYNFNSESQRDEDRMESIVKDLTEEEQDCKEAWNAFCNACEDNKFELAILDEASNDTNAVSVPPLGSELMYSEEMYNICQEFVDHLNHKYHLNL